MSYFNHNLQPKSKDHPLAGIFEGWLSGLTAGLNAPVQGDATRKFEYPLDTNHSYRPRPVDDVFRHYIPRRTQQRSEQYIVPPSDTRQPESTPDYSFYGDHWGE